MEFFTHHFSNRIYQIQGIDFDQSYTPVAHDDSFRINIAIADISNEFHNKKPPIHERVCVSPPPNYIY